MAQSSALRFRLAMVVALNTLPMLAGCGDKAPFPLENVRGTVKYDDGSLIKADQIQIVFDPIDKALQNKVAPRAASAYVDVASGSFGDLTTWKYQDGVIVGRHKVTLIALRLDEAGRQSPSDAIPSDYHRVETTPLEVEVVSGGENDFKLEVVKGAAGG